MGDADQAGLISDLEYAQSERRPDEQLSIASIVGITQSSAQHVDGAYGEGEML